MRERSSGYCLHCGGAKPKYGFGRLQVGEQLLLPLQYRDEKSHQKGVIRVRSVAKTFAERNEWVVSVTTVEGGALVKRVA